MIALIKRSGTGSKSGWTRDDSTFHDSPPHSFWLVVTPKVDSWPEPVSVLQRLLKLAILLGAALHD